MKYKKALTRSKKLAVHANRFSMENKFQLLFTVLERDESTSITSIKEDVEEEETVQKHVIIGSKDDFLRKNLMTICSHVT